uniref:Uncharacterized protein n=1 Tax=Anguilla anguilla TaxID=7936 RepID=A0A0E9T9J1_ANGAN
MEPKILSPQYLSLVRHPVKLFLFSLCQTALVKIAAGQDGLSCAFSAK